MKSITSAEMREIDRRATEEFGIPGKTLMENAGKAVAGAINLLPDKPQKILVVCGSGNNGGDGLVAARHLNDRGHEIKALLVKPPERFKGDALSNYEKAIKLGMDISLLGAAEDFSGYDAIFDALLGTGVKGGISDEYKTAINKINSSGKPVIAVDLPSGLDADTGKVLGTAVKAQITVTMALPKKGFENPEAARYIGKLIVADIGMPEELLK